MAVFRAIRNIPDAPNNPSVDQPKMKINNNSMIDLVDVDHIGYNQNNGGYHDIIHQPPQVADPAVIANIGQLYTKTVNNFVELFYRSADNVPTGVVQQLTNGSGILPRAAVNFSVNAGVITINSSFNVSGVVKVGSVFRVDFTNPLPSAFYYPAITGQQFSGSVVCIAGVSTLNTPSMLTTSITVGFANGISTSIDPVFASVIVFQ